MLLRLMKSMIERRHFVYTITAVAALSVVIVMVAQRAYAQARPAETRQLQDIVLRFEYLRSASAPGTTIHRSRIPGGWLVSGTLQMGESAGYGITFVPEPGHDWDGASIEASE